ncbi:hypothetical protein VB834_27625 [Limnoraphis robusta Tam1]|uniref:hypothetical protein n=1 Tax=Limnoraphis robusta TaxID=1118279 RepID=UPI002B202002|nr:hypothetical protein [Limnoraphis robusta]MEA5542804.1 hypothetical protein [Limnoraphis robusta Tam1]
MEKFTTVPKELFLIVSLPVKNSPTLARFYTQNPVISEKIINNCIADLGFLLDL